MGQANAAATRASSAWSAVAFLLLALALVMSQRRVPIPRLSPRAAQRAAFAAAGLLALLGLAFLVLALAGTSPEWAMPAGTALVYATLAGAVLARGRLPWLSLVAIVFWLGLVYVILVWYVYQVASLVGAGIGTSIGTAAIVPFLALTTGLLLLHVDRGKLQVVVADGPSGQAVRRALVPVLAVPPVVGYIFLQGEAAGLYDSTVKTALVASSLVLVFTLVVSLTARALGRIDARRSAAEAGLAASRRTLEEAQRIGHVGSFEWDTVKDASAWSDELFRIFGLDPSPSGGDLSKALEMMHPDDRERVASAVEAALDGSAPYATEYRIVRPTGEVRHVEARGEVVRDGAGRPLRMVGAVQDITDRKVAQEALLESRRQIEEKARELARSNAELEQFAYVASHDLQEPLRMVASYVQLIERRYKGQLDADADEFIQYAVEGSNRMQSLINDLLLYSRVGSRGRELVPTDVGAALDVARQNLEVAIEESGAIVTNDPLPRARADPTQLGQLFQNLIANAIKFRGQGPPQVHVSGQANGTWCQITVRDNGIGIDPQYFDRIFLIFQRLHSRADFPGTGIGLAVCKRIIERHGGKIWVESKPGEGAAFHFTVPSVQGG